MTPRPHGLLLLLALSGCTDEASGPSPFATVPGTLGKLAINDTSIFAIDTSTNTIVELGLDGSMIGKLPTVGPVSELAAAGDLVAWVETEGTRKNVRRRKAGVVETLSTFSPHIAATAEGLFYSDTGLIASWNDAVPTRIATPTGDVTLIGIDASYAYTLETGMSVQRYDRRMDMKEVVVASTLGATVRDGILGYRTAEGVRVHDLFTKFDALFGMPPATYPCDLLIAGRAIMCGKYRCLESVTEELLDDPVTGYTSIGRDLVWGKTAGASTELYRIDSEAALK
ncbi:MAG: hypothetical protein IPQ07_25485 [Myxococcales bacterium]|nr:hypothetical protein [Myxococcales bacterium]